jgi:hypothetical protein
MVTRQRVIARDALLDLARDITERLRAAAAQDDRGPSTI